MNDLQSRLDEWRKNPLPVKSSEKVRGLSPRNFVPRQMDYGDDIRDYEKKEDAKWDQELQSNQIYKGYR